MLANAEKCPIDALALVKAFENCDFDAMSTVCHQKLRFKNTGVPAQTGRDEIFAGWKSLKKKIPGMSIVINGWGCSANEIFTDRYDVFPLSKNLVLSFRVIGVFKIKNGEIVSWREHFDLLTCGRVIIVALAKWPYKKFFSANMNG